MFGACADALADDDPSEAEEQPSPQGSFPLRSARARDGGQEHTGVVDPHLSFAEWLATHAANVVPTVRSILRALEGPPRGYTDFHLKFANGFDHVRRRPLPGCHVTAFSGSGGPGPARPLRCMSCDLETPLSMGVGCAATGGGVTHEVTARHSLLHESAHTRVWMDAKARPMLILTPKRHAEALSDLSDDELGDLFATLSATLHARGLETLHCAIINHGTYRNHAHVHLKVRFSAFVYDRAVRTSFSADEQRRHAAIQAFRRERDAAADRQRDRTD